MSSPWVQAYGPLVYGLHLLFYGAGLLKLFQLFYLLSANVNSGLVIQKNWWPQCMTIHDLRTVLIIPFSSRRIFRTMRVLPSFFIKLQTSHVAFSSWITALFYASSKLSKTANTENRSHGLNPCASVENVAMKTNQPHLTKPELEKASIIWSRASNNNRKLLERYPTRAWWQVYWARSLAFLQNCSHPTTTCPHFWFSVRTMYQLFCYFVSLVDGFFLTTAVIETTWLPIDSNLVARNISTISSRATLVLELDLWMFVSIRSDKMRPLVPSNVLRFIAWTEETSILEWIALLLRKQLCFGSAHIRLICLSDMEWAVIETADLIGLKAKFVGTSLNAVTIFWAIIFHVFDTATSITPLSSPLFRTRFGSISNGELMTRAERSTHCEIVCFLFCFICGYPQDSSSLYLRVSSHFTYVLVPYLLKPMVFRLVQIPPWDWACVDSDLWLIVSPINSGWLWRVDLAILVSVPVDGYPELDTTWYEADIWLA